MGNYSQIRRADVMSLQENDVVMMAELSEDELASVEGGYGVIYEADPRTRPNSNPPNRNRRDRRRRDRRDRRRR